MNRFVWRLLRGTLIVVALAYVLILGVMFVWQREFQYDRGGRLLDLSETALAGAELVTIETAGGESVTGWYQGPAPDMPVILYFRGNARSFSREHERFAQWVADGYGFLSFDYRGFPGSPGEISQANVLADSLAAFDWLAARGDPIVIWGRSLGSGPGAYVASRRDARALLLETPFISAVAVAADRYWFLPVGFLMFDQFPLEDWIGDVAEPLFVAHGTADRTIGVRHGRGVFGMAPNPQELWIEEGGGHDDLWPRGLWPRARAFFDALATGR